MVYDLDSAYILVLLSVPLQFNLITDSIDLIIGDMKKEWTEKTELTYYQNYFAKKATIYVGCISSIISIFVFYRVRKLRLILSVLFFCSGITWLIYYAMNENRIHLLFIIRSIQGIYLGFFQTASIPFIMNFSKDHNKCFCGCLIQFSMFCGLFLMNLFFNFFRWNVVILIFCFLSLTFSGLIWLVPEINIIPKSAKNEYIISGNNIRLFITMLFAMLFQQLSGIGILIEQLDELLSGIGLEIDSKLQSCLFDFVGALSVINSAFVSDIITTKYMWSISAFGLFIGLLIYATTYKLYYNSWVSSLGVFIYFLFYGLGEGPIPWYLCGTLFHECVIIESSGINVCWNLFLTPIMDYLWKKLKESFDLFGSIIFASATCFIAIFFGFLVIPRDTTEEDDNINLI